MLGGLAMKNKWQLENKSKTGKRPNVIIGENAHICVKKFADYFDVEARVIPTPKEKYYSMSPERIRENINENTSTQIDGNLSK